MRHEETTGGGSICSGKGQETHSFRGNVLGQTLDAVCIREWMLSSNVSNVMIIRQILAIVAPTLARSVCSGDCGSGFHPPKETQ